MKVEDESDGKKRCLKQLFYETLMIYLKSESDGKAKTSEKKTLYETLMIYLESESDGKTKVSEATLSETPMIYLESESDGKTKAFETTLRETLMIYLGLTWELATSSSLSRATTIAFADSRISFLTCHPKKLQH